MSVITVLEGNAVAYPLPIVSHMAIAGSCRPLALPVNDILYALQRDGRVQTEQ